MIRRPPRSTLFPTRRSSDLSLFLFGGARLRPHRAGRYLRAGLPADRRGAALWRDAAAEEDPLHRDDRTVSERSEEHTSELQSPCNLVCRLLLEKTQIMTA